MQTASKPDTLVSQLQAFEPFKDVEPEALQWLIDHSEYCHYPEGDHLFRSGRTVDKMQIILDGEFVTILEQNGEKREMGVWGTGYITGVLPFSRMTHTRADGIALKPTYTLELDKSCFTDLTNVSYQLMQNLVAVMSNRIRDFSKLRSQNEKLMSLGKLSAGLAHELNNPASAMVRSARELRDNVHKSPESFKAILTMRISPEQTDRVNEILFEKVQAGIFSYKNSLARQEVEDDLLDWLDDHEVEEGEDIAAIFADYGFSTEDLDQIEEIMEGKYLDAILGWLESTLNLESLVDEISDSAQRIAELIQSMKSYSRMDQSVAMEQLDLHEGINSTLLMLKHKFKHNQIQLVKDFEESLPKVKGFAGELNQVWTNLIDNALDAMEAKGTLTIKTYRERECACAEIHDTGPGIPEEVRSSIFDPFFTTKEIGKGTGLGLDITRRLIERHKGSIHVESEPGHTVFKICIPL